VIDVQVASADLVSQATEDISAILRERHNVVEGDEDFIIQSQEDILDASTEISDTLTLFLGGIAAISLVVGGIGIMNIMLVSVTERTREIGIRKAVGARRQDILIQFLLESATLSLMGGLIGIVVGWLTAVDRRDPARASGGSVGPSMLVLMATAADGGRPSLRVYPATRAARPTSDRGAASRVRPGATAAPRGRTTARDPRRSFRFPEPWAPGLQLQWTPPPREEAAAQRPADSPRGSTHASGVMMRRPYCFSLQPHRARAVTVPPFSTAPGDDARRVCGSGQVAVRWDGPASPRS
jgi:hypothetical protein